MFWGPFDSYSRGAGAGKSNLDGSVPHRDLDDLPRGFPPNQPAKGILKYTHTLQFRGQGTFSNVYFSLVHLPLTFKTPDRCGQCQGAQLAAEHLWPASSTDRADRADREAGGGG